MIGVNMALVNIESAVRTESIQQFSEMANRLAKLFTNSFKLATSDLANQYALPVKSMTGHVVSKYGAAQTLRLNEKVVEQMALDKDDFVFEIGFGTGDALKMCFEKLTAGKGMVNIPLSKLSSISCFRYSVSSDLDTWTKKHGRGSFWRSSRPTRFVSTLQWICATYRIPPTCSTTSFTSTSSISSDKTNWWTSTKSC